MLQYSYTVDCSADEKHRVLAAHRLCTACSHFARCVCVSLPQTRSLRVTLQAVVLNRPPLHVRGSLCPCLHRGRPRLPTRPTAPTSPPTLTCSATTARKASRCRHVHVALASSSSLLLLVVLVYWPLREPSALGRLWVRCMLCSVDRSRWWSVDF
eukprot:COSAG01_NODE_170_length_23136_cov_24.853931_8_plen_155_part_00